MKHSYLYKKVIIFLGLIAFGLVAIFYIYDKNHTKNIFDEVYYSTLDYIRGKDPKMSLEKIQGIKRLSDVERGMSLSYQSVSWEYMDKNNQKILISVKNNSVKISKLKNLNSNVTLKIILKYDLSSKKVKRELIIFDENNIIENKTNVQSYLNKYKISQKELNKEVDELMYQTFFVDWIASNKRYTKFSSSNFGEFKLDEKE